MNSKISFLLTGATLVSAFLLASCASDAGSAAAASPATPGSPRAASPAGDAVAKLKKNLTAAEVRALLGAPASIKPIVVGEAKGENWSYLFNGPVTTRTVPVATQDVPAVNPLTGQSISRPEPVYQNQDVQLIDTLHLLLFDGRVIEWTIVRDEKKQFQ